MTSPLVLREDSYGVSTLTLNRPDKLNALHVGVFAELRAHLEELATDSSVHCLVLTGAGRSFCAGHDLSVLAGGEAEETSHFEAETIDLLEEFPRPTIAKIRGHCLTGGLELALGCDLLMAAETASFGDTHGKWGLVPVWGMSVRLPERVGMARAKELSFTSRKIDAGTALGYGLIDRCVPEGELDTAVSLLAFEIAANSAGTNRIYKKLYARARGSGRRAALESERGLPFGLPDDMGERLRG
ncbi:enoyl-CoA hydratase/carnithine racemase [Nocardia transvalensis]|uniref:Enoyl-CoA hydratase/carnithine racemase n=1 Tax=Nocardia transvalensis TaxID=37333 RepID=A0A7W9PBM4_9NOCA|nr:enoyl-CoA hydratase-related protein [Nocardia transvalensis]MBB5913000.1 enoyl-CoA hydratase/carnithine racemase [Nocardia transvalensis]